MKYRTVTAQEMRELDRRATQEYKVPSLTLMENAGRAVADAVEKLAPRGGNVLVLCGSGNNGGDGLVAARYLKERGYNVKILLMKAPDAFKGDALQNYKALDGKDIEIGEFAGKAACAGYNVIIDALLGFGGRGPVTGSYAAAIDGMNASKTPVVAVDIPSGLDADTGEILGTAVKAKVTVTMALPKKGFENPKAKEYLGEVIVADIGIPFD